ncbi:lasso peptide biosynthesis B2 protein [Enterobacter kobei]|nr:lasso peptide biosynthesis B2 protein [Enterobacter kobei]
MKYRDFAHNLHPVRVRDQIIILNITDNKFHILSKRESITLLKCYTSENNITYRGRDVLDKKYHNYDRYNLFEVKNSMGVNVNFWGLRDEDISFSNIADQLKLLKALYVSHKLVQKGLPHTIDTLKRLCAKSKKKELDIPLTVKRLNAASLLYPNKTKCLEWSVAFFYHVIQHGYRPVLKIGVQNRPFYSHAWIEIDDKIIGDIKDLNERMSVIFKINPDVNK